MKIEGKKPIEINANLTGSTHEDKEKRVMEKQERKKLDRILTDEIKPNLTHSSKFSSDVINTNRAEDENRGEETDRDQH